MIYHENDSSGSSTDNSSNSTLMKNRKKHLGQNSLYESNLNMINDFFTNKPGKSVYTNLFNKNYKAAGDIFTKKDIIDKINMLFSQLRTSANTKNFGSIVLVLSGTCSNTNPALIFKSWDKETYNTVDFTVTYNDILKLWKARANAGGMNYMNMKHTWKKLHIIVDCPNSHIWTSQCKLSKDFKEISIQASTNKKYTKQIVYKNYGSLFLHNILQRDSIKSYVINSSKQMPSYCGFYYRNIRNFGFESMFDSWNQMNKNLKNKIYNKVRIHNTIYEGEVLLNTNNSKNSTNSTNNNSTNSTITMENLSGQGLAFNSNGVLYHGEFFKGKFLGFGELTTQTFYEGFFANNIPNGPGVLYFNNDKKKFNMMEGIFSNGKMNGPGRFYALTSGQLYTGAFKDNKFNGKGVLIYNDGSKQIGNFKEHNLHGEVKELNAKGKVIFNGLYENNLRNGKGTVNLKNFNKITCIYKDDKPDESNCNITFTSKSKIDSSVFVSNYKGEIKDDKMHGKGELESKKFKYKGYFNYGLIDGEGEYEDFYTKEVIKGKFSKGNMPDMRKIDL